MKSMLLGAVLCVFASPLWAASSTLTTPSYVVTIETHCQEGDVTCNNVSYHGVSKKTGKAINLKGKTMHTSCRNGDPCRFLGYEFKSGNILYRVFEEGSLEVTQKGKTLLQENGKWDWQ